MKNLCFTADISVAGCPGEKSGVIITESAGNSQRVIAVSAGADADSVRMSLEIPELVGRCMDSREENTVCAMVINDVAEMICRKRASGMVCDGVAVTDGTYVYHLSTGGQKLYVIRNGRKAVKGYRRLQSCPEIRYLFMHVKKDDLLLICEEDMFNSIDMEYICGIAFLNGRNRKRRKKYMSTSGMLRLICGITGSKADVKGGIVAVVECLES